MWNEKWSRQLYKTGIAQSQGNCMSVINMSLISLMPNIELHSCSYTTAYVYWLFNCFYLMIITITMLSDPHKNVIKNKEKNNNGIEAFNNLV